LVTHNASKNLSAASILGNLWLLYRSLFGSNKVNVGVRFTIVCALSVGVCFMMYEFLSSCSKYGCAITSRVGFISHSITSFLLFALSFNVKYLLMSLSLFPLVCFVCIPSSEGLLFICLLLVSLLTTVSLPTYNSIIA
jgi:hypothetical protein